MNTALQDKKKSEIVRRNQPIVIDPEPRMVGYPVYCGNDSVDEYRKKQVDEHERGLHHGESI